MMERPKVHQFLSIVMIVAGMALMIFMIHTESEPGAVPLLLVMLGMGWFFITLFRSRGKKEG